MVCYVCKSSVDAVRRPGRSDLRLCDEFEFEFVEKTGKIPVQMHLGSMTLVQGAPYPVIVLSHFTMGVTTHQTGVMIPRRQAADLETKELNKIKQMNSQPNPDESMGPFEFDQPNQPFFASNSKVVGRSTSPCAIESAKSTGDVERGVSLKLAEATS